MDIETFVEMVFSTNARPAAVQIMADAIRAARAGTLDEYIELCELEVQQKEAMERRRMEAHRG